MSAVHFQCIACGASKKHHIANSRRDTAQGEGCIFSSLLFLFLFLYYISGKKCHKMKQFNPLLSFHVILWNCIVIYCHFNFAFGKFLTLVV